MNQVTKDEILKQVGAVLQFCQEIVSKLSSPQCSCDTSEYVSMSNISDILTNNISNCDSEFDAPTEKVPVNDMPMKKVPVYDIPKEEVPVYDIPTEKVPEYNAPREKVPEYDAPTEKIPKYDALEEKPLRRWPTYYNITEAEAEEYQDETDDFREDVLSMISAACPNAIYDRNWRENALRSFIHPLLLSVWDNAIAIFDENSKEDEPEYVPPPAVNIYHTIDLHNVNSRFIENIPKPNSYPVLGVSQDPDFYHKRYDRGDPTKCFLSSYPHGALSGYETNLGIVAPPKEPIHGYIWSDRFRSYVLHAVLPEEEGSRRRRMRKG